MVYKSNFENLVHQNIQEILGDEKNYHKLSFS